MNWSTPSLLFFSIVTLCHPLLIQADSLVLYILQEAITQLIFLRQTSVDSSYLMLIGFDLIR